jgi:pyrroline-5-carboxylate reductase
VNLDNTRVRSHKKLVKVGIIGVGRMGSALVRGFLNAKMTKKGLLVSDYDKEKLKLLCKDTGVKMASDNIELVNRSEIVIIAVKPKDLKKVLDEIFGNVGEKLVVSTVAGVPIAVFERKLKGAKVVRIMPNIACSVGEGAIAFSAGSQVRRKDLRRVKELLDKLGIALELPENQLDVVTGLSGSGPAFYSLVIKAMAMAGVEEGLPEDVALRLAVQTAKGVGKLLFETGMDPEELVGMVRSPGGTTEAGLKKLEESAVTEALKEAVHAAVKRAKELKQSQ